MNTVAPSNSLRSLAKQFLWPTFGKDPSYFDTPGSIIVSADGCHVTDIDGNRYIDSTACAGAATLGFNHPQVVEAMAKQMERLVQNPSGWPASAAQIQVAEKLAALSPGSLSYTLFGCSGTDANEAAIKIARQYYKARGKGTKYKVIGRFRNYHGMSLATLAAGGSVERRRQYEPLPGGFEHISPPYGYRCKYDSEHPDWGARYAEELREVIEFHDPATVACYIGEQTVTIGGVLPPPSDYMPRIREICDEYDVLLIADEVVTGLGRTGTWLECVKYGVTPDIVTLGKGLTSGHAALSATLVKEEIASVFFGEPANLLQHGHTFGGMAVACAAALATIEVLEGSEILKLLPQRSAEFHEQLAQLGERSAVIGDVRSHGMLFGVELVSDKATKATWPSQRRREIAGEIVAIGKRHGVLLTPSILGGTLVIVVSPPLDVPRAEMEQIVAAVEASTREVEQMRC